MEDFDKDYEVEDSFINDEERQFLDEVVQGDHTLLYLDTYLREMMR